MKVRFPASLGNNLRSAGMDRATLIRWAGAWAVVLFLALGPVAAATDIYIETVIDTGGQLRITTKHKREIVPKKDTEQVSYDNPQISPDGHAVGWLALYPDCCASYPIPLKLVILVNGAQRILTGSGLPISRWCFWAGGKQVAFEQETVHGGMGAHYELRDVESGQLADIYDPDAKPNVITKPPRWVVVLDSKR